MTTRTDEGGEGPRVLRVFNDEAGEGGEDAGGEKTGQEGGAKDSLIGGEGGEGTGQKTGQEGTPGTGDTPPKLPEGAFKADAFQEALPEDLRQNPAIAKHKDFESFARSHVHAQSMIGKDSDRIVELPGSDDADGRVGLLQKLGAPEDPKGYEITPPEGTPDFLKPDAENSIMPSIFEAAQKQGVLPDQMQAIYDTFTEQVKKAAEHQGQTTEATHSENLRALEAKWGQAFDQKVAAANFAIDKYGGDEVRERLNAAGLGTDPNVMEMLADLGAARSKEDGVEGTGQGSGADFSGKLTPDQATAKGKELLRMSLNETNIAEQRRLANEAQKFFKMAKPGVVQ